MSSNVSDIPLILQNEKKKRRWYTVGSIVNYINSLLLLATFITCIIVIGTVGSIQSNLKSYIDPDNKDTPTNTTNQPRHACYMFSSCDGDIIDDNSHCYFKPGETIECEAVMVGYSFIAFVCFIFFIIVLVHAILNLRISWFVAIEVLTLVVLLLFGFSMSVMISIGNLVTCKSIKSFYKVKDCNREFPYKKFSYRSLADTAMNSSWSVFIILLILLIVYFIRLGIFLRRRKKSKEPSAEEPSAEELNANTIETNQEAYNIFNDINYN